MPFGYWDIFWKFQTVWNNVIQEIIDKMAFLRDANKFASNDKTVIYDALTTKQCVDFLTVCNKMTPPQTHLEG